MKLPEQNSTNFTPTPVGQHNAVLTRFIDLGTQPGSQMYPKPKHKVLMAWEIPAERIEWEKDGQTHEGPVVHFERMTFSSHENSIFRQRLESWRGVPFTNEDFGNFDCKTLLGVGALLQIAHDNRDGNKYANLQVIMKPPGGKETWVKPEGELIYFSIADFDQAVFDGFSSGLQETIKKSPEYQTLMGLSQGDQGHMDEAPPRELEDEIPF